MATIDRIVALTSFSGTFVAALEAINASGDDEQASENAEAAKGLACPLLQSTIEDAGDPGAVWNGVDQEVRNAVTEHCGYPGPEGLS